MITMISGCGRIEAALSSIPFVRCTGAVMAMMLALSACGGDDPESAAVPGDFSATLERTVCFGSCPVYTVSVDASGLVQYDGTDVWPCMVISNRACRKRISARSWRRFGTSTSLACRTFIAATKAIVPQVSLTEP
jgi:hypothetical protein